ncbi:MAG: thioredoxin family protein [Verrucomicrobia bacterium]|nr:thioredoxin family protein [Verrucomicrobiota bacterium]
MLIILAFFGFNVGHSAAENTLLSTDSEPKQSISLSPIWSQDLDDAFLQAQEEQKILVVAFLGDAWCPWAEKLKGDVLNSPQFLNSLKGIAHCAAVSLDEEDSEHNKQMREIFHIEQSPTIVLFDYSQEEIARLGFLPLSAKDYAVQVLELAQHFEEVIAFLKSPKSVSSEEQMAQLYAHAKKLSSQSYRDQILQIGLKKEKGSFFILEKYAGLLEKFKFKSETVQKTRKELIDKDPDNKMGTQLKMAILEFQKLGTKVKSKRSIYKAVSPLVHYVEKFGKDDQENLWKVEMMIAQFFFTKNEREQALAHAQASLQAAPEKVKGEVKDVVDYITGS